MKKTMRNSSILIGILLVVILTAGCLRLLYPSQPKAVAVFTPPDGYAELTETDGLAVKGVQSTTLSIFGIHLGSSMAEVVERLGKPDVQTSPKPGIVNFEYSTRLNMSRIGLLVHLDDEIVTRITLKKPFNPSLHGESVINHTKEDLYRMFGKPDRIQLLSGLTVYSYYDQGIEAVMDGPQLNGWSFIFPQPEKARESKK